MIIIGGVLVLFIYITRLASNKIFSPSNKIHWEVGQAKDLSAPPVLVETCNSTDICCIIIIILYYIKIIYVMLKPQIFY